MPTGMRVVIAGAGEVGFRVARDLINRDHQVTLIDRDPGRVRHAQSLDAQVLEGHAASARVLIDEAELPGSDLFIAVTGRDEVNIIGCTLAEALGCRTMARINNPVLTASPADHDHLEILGLHTVISPDELAMRRIWQILSRPSLTRLDNFKIKQLRILEVKLDEGSPAVGRSVENLSLPPHCRVVLVSRRDGVTIPRPTEVLLPRDRLLVLLIDARELEELSEVLGSPREVTNEAHIKRLMIAGSTRVALQLAERVARRYRDVEIYLVEPDRERAEVVSAELPDKVTVLHGSPTDRHFLREEGVRHDDLFVGATAQEELNVLSCLLAKREGAKRTAALIHQPELEYVVQDTGIDALINPRMVTVNAIINRATATEDVAGLEQLRGDMAAVREFLIRDSCKLLGKTVAKLGLPRQALVALITRNGKSFFPEADEKLAADDRLLVFTLRQLLPEVERRFS